MECNTASLSADPLLTRLKEDVKGDNVTQCTNKIRCKLRDFLEGISASCGKGSGRGIEIYLFEKLCLDKGQQSSSSMSQNPVQQDNNQKTFSMPNVTF